MRVPLHPCFILHQRPYRESSLIVEAFSSEHGRLGIVARGARRSRNTRRALLQPLRKVNLAWTMHRELGTLTDAESADTALPPSGSGTIAAFYINELLIRLLHRHESHPELFDAYELALRELASVQKDSQEVLRLFEKRLLTALGYGLVLDRDVISGEPIEHDRGYYFLRARTDQCRYGGPPEFSRIGRHPVGTRVGNFQRCTAAAGGKTADAVCSCRASG